MEMKLTVARSIIQAILDNRKEIRIKNILQLEALHTAATLLEQACADGANLGREAKILRYQATNTGAFLFCDDITRGALEAGLRQIEKRIALQEGVNDEDE